MDLVISIVAYNNTLNEIQHLLNELNKLNLKKYICIVDNSDKEVLNKKEVEPYNVRYFKPAENIGFGRGHNIVLKKYIEVTKNFLIINPDIFISANDVEKAVNFINNNKNIGILAPKVIHNEVNKSREYHLSSTCHLVPTPFNLFAKRFFSKYFKKSIDFYNLESMDKDKIQFVPNLSGCCLFVSSLALKNIGFFDERFFLYMEDVDFVRRFVKSYWTIYFPEIEAIHERKSLSYKQIKYLLIHLFSAIKYFNKWGWFFDKERKNINNITLKLLNSQLDEIIKNHIPLKLNI